MFRFLKGHIEYLAQHLQPEKCIPKEQNVDMKPTLGKVWAYRRQSVSKPKFHKQCLSFMITKNYDKVSSNNEVIAKTSSAFLKFSKHFLNQRWPLSAAV